MKKKNKFYFNFLKEKEFCGFNRFDDILKELKMNPVILVNNYEVIFMELLTA
jgi:hypothetical protein